jgi:hypothetical protein
VRRGGGAAFGWKSEVAYDRNQASKRLRFKPSSASHGSGEMNLLDRAMRADARMRLATLRSLVPVLARPFQSRAFRQRVRCIRHLNAGEEVDIALDPSGRGLALTGIAD